MDHYDQLLTDLELYIVRTAKEHDANAFYRLRSVPGIGKILALVILYEIHDINRFPTVQDFVSYARLVKCAKESAGKRHGTSGKKIGNVHLKWAFSEASVLFLRANPKGQRFVEKLSSKHGKAKALSILAHKLGRAVYQNAYICELEPELSHRPFNCAHIPLVRAVDENVSIRRSDEKRTERLGAYVINVADHLMRRKRCRLILFGAHIAGQDRPRRIRLPSHGDGRLIRRSPLLRETRLPGGSDKDHSQDSYANIRSEQCLHVNPPVLSQLRLTRCR